MADHTDITRFFTARRILITGVTGFVGKALVEKILYAAPEVSRIYTLIRVKGSGGERSAAARLEREVTDSPIFGRLRRRHGSAFERFFQEKVTAVAGDLADPRLGLSDEAYRTLAEEVEVVVHSAAAVSFDERLDVALALNTLGPQWVARFAREAGVESFVHVSTCYVSGTRRGDIKEALPEASAGQGDPGTILDLDQAVKEIRRTCGDIEAASRESERRERFLAEARAEAEAGGGVAEIPLEERAEERRRLWVKGEMVTAGMELARRAGWNDTYTYTKALGELLVARAAAGLSAAIVRPSIIESSYAEPEPGWIDGFRMADPILVAYGKGTLHDFPGKPEIVLDLIPLDHVVNAILAITTATAGRSDLCVYQVATGDVNPVTLGELYAYVRGYFAAHPMHDASGREIVPRRWSFPGAAGFRRYYQWRYQIPLRIVERILSVLPKGGRWRGYRERAAGMLSRVEQILYYARIYAPYTAHGARYRTDHTRRVFAAQSEEERRLYPFDPGTIDWRRYIAEIHIPGIKRWVLKMTPFEPLPVARPLKGLPDTATEPTETLRTIPDLLRRSVYRHRNKVALQVRRGSRPVRYTYAEVLSLTRVVGQELARAGLEPGDRVVLWAENQPEWGIGYLGIAGMGVTAVPLDYQTPVKEVWSLAGFTEAKAILTTEERARSLRRGRPETPETGRIQLLNLYGWAAPFGASPEFRDRDESGEPEVPDPDRPASILFTSGTTLAPKGVCLSHRNFIANVLSVSQALHPLESDQFLSILPLHHALEFTGGFLTALFGGATITYLEGLNAAAILTAMQETGTTVVIAVPRLLEVFWNRIREQVPQALHFAWADSVGGPRKHLVPLARAVVGRQVRNRFGGKLRLLVVGGAALDPAIWHGFERLGIPVCEGYGLTETAPVVTVNPLERRRPGCVGPTLPEVEVRIADADERGVGEIRVRGENVMQGYLRDPERNRQVLVDGWFRTGDFGFLDAEGGLHIVGRVDDLIVTPAGKNVHPDEVEVLYKDLPGVKELCVVGVSPREGAAREVHAVIVPEEHPGDTDPSAVEKALQDAIAERSREVPSHHRIQRVHFRWEELPKGATYKVKRSALQRELEQSLRAEARPEAASAGPSDAWAREVIESVARLVKTAPAMISLTDRLQTDLAVDSLMRVDLAAEIEHRFGIKVPDDRVEGWETVGDIVAEVRQRTRS